MEQKSQPVPHSHFSLVVERVSQGMAAIGAIMLSVMMFISIADISGRYFFIHPIKGTFELVGILMVVIGTFGMAQCQLQKRNLRIDIVANRLSSKAQIILFIPAYLVCVITTGLICWQGALLTHEYLYAGSLGKTIDLHIPFWPIMLLMSIGFGWTCVIFLIDLYNTCLKLVK